MTETEDIKELEEYYRKLDLGIFLSGEEERTLSNLQAARTIVEGFFNGQEVCELGKEIDITEKKHTLECLLNHPFLKKGSPIDASLQRVLTRMNQEKISDEIAEKIYKLIIYLSVIPLDIGTKKITFSELVGVRTFVQTYNLIKKIGFKINDISVSVLLEDIRKKSEQIYGNKYKSEDGNKDITIRESESGEIISYYEGLGLSDYIKADGKFIYSYENLQQARQIVEEYFREIEISEEEKKSVLMCILGTPLLRTNNIRDTYDLSTRVNRMKARGLKDREVYAIIIKLGIEGKMLNHSYGSVLYRWGGLIDDVLKCKETERQIEVDSDMLEKAKSKSRYKEQEINICEYYRTLGIGYIYDKAGKLCYSESDLNMVRQITEGYFEGVDVTDEAKRAVIRSLLKSQELKLAGDSNFEKLLTVINKMRGKGLVDRYIYGFLINLSFGNTIKNLDCTYNRILKDPGELDCILNEKVQNNATVTSETLVKMVNLMRKREGIIGMVSGRDLAKAGASAPTALCDDVKNATDAMLDRMGALDIKK